jgi:hypothetical protein
MSKIKLVTLQPASSVTDEEIKMPRVMTRTAKICLRDDDLLQMVSLPNAQEGLADAQANVAAGFRLSFEQRRPLLVDLRAVKSIDRAARNYYSSTEAAGKIIALALLVESPVSRLVANFLIGLNKVPVSTKLFTSEGEAVAWLKQFLGKT